MWMPRPPYASHAGHASLRIFRAATLRLRRAIMDENYGSDLGNFIAVFSTGDRYFQGSHPAPLARHYE